MASSANAPAPAVVLYPYQRAWIADQAKFKIGMMARQSGKTFTCTLEVVDDCLDQESRGHKARWVILSRGERQAREAMEEGIKRHLSAYRLGFQAYEWDWSPDIKAMEVVLPGGSRITALPANPDTARGFSASLLLDEFAFHQDSRKIWMACFPLVSRPGLKLRVISTPNGKQNKFYELMTDPGGQWSRHVVDIYQAVADGLPRNIAELKDGINDPDAWAQEYECKFIDETTAFLTYDMISAIEDEKAGNPARFAGGPCYAGMDIGRRRDLSVIWVLEKVGDVFWTREVATLRHATFAAQEAELDRIYRAYRPVRLCIDQSGMGEKPVEDAIRKYGAYAVEGVLFTVRAKLELANGLRRLVEDRRVRIPQDRDIRDDLHSVKKVVTSAGNIRFDAERSENAHADRFWALALALHAGSTQPVVLGFESTGRIRETARMGGYFA